MKLRAITLAVGLALSAGAGATTLSGKATADNAFWAYVSTSDSVLGTLIGSGDKGVGPLIFQVNGKPFRGFLDGRVDGERYQLLLHLSDLEYKVPEAKTKGDA